MNTTLRAMPVYRTMGDNHEMRATHPPGTNQYDTRYNGFGSSHSGLSNHSEPGIRLARPFGSQRAVVCTKGVYDRQSANCRSCRLVTRRDDSGSTTVYEPRSGRCRRLDPYSRVARPFGSRRSNSRRAKARRDPVTLDQARTPGFRPRPQWRVWNTGRAPTWSGRHFLPHARLRTR
jgi:hypothetical protein